MFKINQIGGGACSLCGSPNTNRSTCPLNKDAKSPKPSKHPNARGKLSPEGAAAPRQLKLTLPKAQEAKQAQAKQARQKQQTMQQNDEIRLNTLPTDIHDNIAGFLGDRDLGRFLSTSRNINVSGYLVRRRRQANWKGQGVARLAEKGDIPGLQYLNSIGTDMKDAMDHAGMSGHADAMEYLHSIGCRPSQPLMYYAAGSGHLEVVKFLHKIGANSFSYSMDNAAEYGHLDVVKYLHSIGAQFHDKTIDVAARNGHIDVVEYLKKIAKIPGARAYH